MMLTFILSCVAICSAMLITTLKAKEFCVWWFVMSLLWGFHDCAICTSCSSLVVPFSPALR